MRKWNTILSVLMLLIFMIHGIMGSFMLNGVGSTSCMDWCWYSCCAYGDWCHPDSSEFTDSEAIRKNVSETERHILGETSQWDGNTDSAVIPYWLVWKGAEWDIYFVPFYNGKDGNSAFVRGGNLCSYFYQYPPIARITGNH